jgi:hypothetical protein
LKVLSHRYKPQNAAGALNSPRAVLNSGATRHSRTAEEHHLALGLQ